MSAKIGNLSFKPSQRYSEQTAKVIDEEVQKIVEGAYLRTKKLLTERRAEVELVRLV